MTKTSLILTDEEIFTKADGANHRKTINGEVYLCKENILWLMAEARLAQKRLDDDKN